MNEFVRKTPQIKVRLKYNHIITLTLFICKDTETQIRPIKNKNTAAYDSVLQIRK